MAAKSSSLYFAYGSNLWLHQMSKRCPESPFVGTARLHGWRFIINQRGYATIVPSKNDHVWALVYDLTPKDEATVVDDAGVPTPPDCSPGRTVSSLVYVDEKRTKEGLPKEEYIYRVGMGIEDAVANGVPIEYFEKYVRPFIPEKSHEELEEMARPRVLTQSDVLQ